MMINDVNTYEIFSKRKRTFHLFPEMDFCLIHSLFQLFLVYRYSSVSINTYIILLAITVSIYVYSVVGGGCGLWGSLKHDSQPILPKNNEKIIISFYYSMIVSPCSFNTNYDICAVDKIVLLNK